MSETGHDVHQRVKARYLLRKQNATLFSITHQLDAAGLRKGTILALRMKTLPDDVADWLWQEIQRQEANSKARKARQPTPLQISVWRQK